MVVVRRGVAKWVAHSDYISRWALHENILLARACGVLAVGIRAVKKVYPSPSTTNINVRTVRKGYLY